MKIKRELKQLEYSKYRIFQFTDEISMDDLVCNRIPSDWIIHSKVFNQRREDIIYLDFLNNTRTLSG